MNQYKNDVSEARLVPSSGGIFEVRVDGRTVFSKKQESGRFPETGEALERIASH